MKDADKKIPKIIKLLMEKKGIYLQSKSECVRWIINKVYSHLSEDSKSDTSKVDVVKRWNMINDNGGEKTDGKTIKLAKGTR